MTPTDNAGGVHRRLDALFAGVEPTDENQDLKEEIRANLLARVAELQAGGLAPASAIDTAFAELGGLDELLDAPPASGRPAPAGASSPAAAALRNRVRPSGGFVARTVVLALAAAAALVLLVLGLTPVLPLGTGILIALAVVVGAGLGVVTGDSLAQETTTEYPMPRARAAGYGAATGILLASLAAIAVVVVRGPLGWIAAPAVLAVGAIAWLSYLGATQTNRRKAWVLAEARRHEEIGNRFTEDPAAAARFGIYTAVLWTLAGVAFLVIGFTAGWLWALIAPVIGFAVMLLLLASMLFGARR